MGRDLAVVFQRFVTIRLLVGTGEGNVADLKQLRGGKKGHVRRIVKERIAEAALVDEDGGEAGALGFNGTGHAGGLAPTTSTSKYSTNCPADSPAENLFSLMLLG